MKDEPNRVYYKLIKDNIWLFDDCVNKTDEDKYSRLFKIYIPSMKKTLDFTEKLITTRKVKEEY